MVQKSGPNSLAFCGRGTESMGTLHPLQPKQTEMQQSWASMSPAKKCILLFIYRGKFHWRANWIIYPYTSLWEARFFYFFFHMVQNPLLLSSFSLFLAPFIFMCFGMKHFCFNLNSSFPFLASYSLQPQRSHGKLSHSFLTSVFLEKASRVPCFLV